MSHIPMENPMPEQKHPVHFNPPLPFACECGRGKMLLAKWDSNPIPWMHLLCGKVHTLTVKNGEVVNQDK